MNNRIKIAIVDDDLLFAEALQLLVASNDSYDVLFTATNGDDLLRQLGTHVPDILLLDLKLGSENGLEIGESIHQLYRDIKIIALSSYFNPTFVAPTLARGFSGFIAKNSNSKTLKKALDTVYQTGIYIGDLDMATISKQLVKKEPITFGNNIKFTTREQEVLELICHQMTAVEIGKKLFISQRTVETYRTNLMVKTGVKNVVGLVIFAITNQLVDIDKIALNTSITTK